MVYHYSKYNLGKSIKTYGQKLFLTILFTVHKVTSLIQDIKYRIPWLQETGY